MLGGPHEYGGWRCTASPSGPFEAGGFRAEGNVVCFSVQADVVAGVVLLPMAVVSLREVRHVREVPFASLPLLFAVTS